jgi:putative nucleotide binding protein
MPNEEKALVLDYLQAGKPNSYKHEPIAQVVGTEFFTLLEVVPKVPLKALETVYVGKEERKEIDHINKRITFSELTSTGSLELEKAVEEIVHQDPKRFVEFYNTAAPITIKRHQLELLPGLGKKHMLDLLAERQKKPFESFEDIIARVRLMPNPEKTIVKRILEEVEELDVKHFLFSRAPPKKFDRPFNRRY